MSNKEESKDKWDELTEQIAELQSKLAKAQADVKTGETKAEKPKSKRSKVIEVPKLSGLSDEENLKRWNNKHIAEKPNNKHKKAKNMRYNLLK